MKTLLVFTILLLVGCGSEKEPLTVDPDFQPALDLYLSIAPDRGHLNEMVSISYSTDLEPGVNATCNVKVKTYEANGVKYKDPTTERRILVRPGVAKAPSFYLYALVAHELGHCLHDLPHVEGDSKALMAEEVFESEPYWQYNLPQEIARLFR